MINVDDFRSLSKKLLPPLVFDYLEGGAEDELGLQHNRQVFQNLRFRPRRMCDVSKRDSTKFLFGRRNLAPLIIAPTGLNSIFWPHGDIALARAAAKEGIPFVLSTASNVTIEEVAKNSDGDLWFQLYVLNRTSAEKLVNRALKSGYSTLVLTVDVTLNGKRERDLRNNFKLPMRYTCGNMLLAAMHPQWAWRQLKNGIPHLANFAETDYKSIEAQTALMSRQMDMTFNWKDFAWIRQLWPHKLFVKGIIHPEDAFRCVVNGADGIILSNHGGRQLDSCISPIEVLPDVAPNISQPILIDSGIRRGSDILKAIALGAHGVLLGRAALYGLAAAGESGVREVLRILKSEIDVTLAQIGCTSLDMLSSDYLHKSEMTAPLRIHNLHGDGINTDAIQK